MYFLVKNGPQNYQFSYLTEIVQKKVDTEVFGRLGGSPKSTLFVSRDLPRPSRDPRDPLGTSETISYGYGDLQIIDLG